MLYNFRSESSLEAIDTINPGPSATPEVFDAESIGYVEPPSTPSTSMSHISDADSCLSTLPPKKKQRKRVEEKFEAEFFDR